MIPESRSPNDEPRGVYELLVVGGGIQGAWIALEAARAGLRVALVEKGDFGSGTSGNSLKVLHGGLRYLQHGNLKRIRESRRSVRATRVVAGDWIEEIPFYLETRGKGFRGPWAMRGALLLYGLLCRLWPDGGRGPGGWVFGGDPAGVVPGGVFSPDANGVARWNESVMRNSERVIFEVIRAAAKEGADCENYCEVTEITGKTGEWSAKVVDHRSGDRGVIRARNCVEATGPAVELGLGSGGLDLLRAVNLVFHGKPLGDKAVGLESRENSKDLDALVRTGNRLLFFVPRGDQTMVGTWYDQMGRSSTEVSEEDLDRWLSEIEAVAPGMGLNLRNLRYWHSGLLPADARVDEGAQPAKESEILKIAPGRLAVRTVKYTTAPEVARDSLECLGVRLAPRLVSSKHRERSAPPFTWETLLRSSEEVDPRILEAAVREEKIYHLEDALLRRSNVALDEYCTQRELDRAAGHLGRVLSWDEPRCAEEVARVQSRLRMAPESEARMGGGL